MMFVSLVAMTRVLKYSVDQFITHSDTYITQDTSRGFPIHLRLISSRENKLSTVKGQEATIGRQRR